MSIESAKTYVERMKTDEEFRKKVLSIEDAGKRMKFVKMQGFDFSANEIKGVLAELEDSDLERGLGGDLT